MSVLCSSISTVFGFIFETALSGRHCSTTWHSSTSLCWAHWFFWVVHILLANVRVCGGIALKCLLSLQCDPGWKADYPEGFFCWFWTISVYDTRVWSSLFFSSMLFPQWQCSCSSSGSLVWKARLHLMLFAWIPRKSQAKEVASFLFFLRSDMMCLLFYRSCILISDMLNSTLILNDQCVCTLWYLYYSTKTSFFF